MPYFNELIIFAAAYLLGSILFAVWIVRLLGFPDPRTVGSGNPGASNVARECGKLAGGLVLLGDVLKGFLPVWIVQQIGFADLPVALAGLAAYLGHLFPVYHRFRGGKGVATLIGCLTAFDLLSAVVAVVLWGIIVKLSRYVSLGSILVSPITPALIWWSTQSPPLILVTAAMGLATIVKHRDNVQRLLAGREVKIK